MNLNYRSRDRGEPRRPEDEIGCSPARRRPERVVQTTVPTARPTGATDRCDRTGPPTGDGPGTFGK